jgi:hypothetical protein
MRADRYLKVILTIIAVELGWIAVQHTGTAVSAQQTPTPTPVVITGIELQERTDFLPVSVLGQARNVPAELAGRFRPLDTAVRNDQSIPVSIPLPIDVRAIGTVRIDTSRPLKVENVGYTPAPRPGE